MYVSHNQSVKIRDILREILTWEDSKRAKIREKPGKTGGLTVMLVWS